MDKQQILVVDDYDELRELIAFALMAEGYVVSEAATGAEALAEIDSNKQLDAIVLDLGLPDIDGAEVCRQARTKTDAPILMLTGEASPEMAAKMLDMGATDYMRKPVELVELSARIRAALRRKDRPAGLPEAVGSGPLQVDVHRETATFGGRPVDVSGTELRVLAYLIVNAGEVVSKEEFLRDLWDDERDPHLVEVHVSAIRRKLEAAGCADDPIKTVRSFGYRFVPLEE